MNTHSEGTIQAELYHQCRLLGLKVALEFTTAVGRLDVAIISPTGNLVAAVEVKKFKPFYETAQVKRYKTLGVPVFELWEFDKCASMALTLAGVVSEGVSVFYAKTAYLPDGHELKRRKQTRYERAYDKLRRSLV